MQALVVSPNYNTFCINLNSIIIPVLVILVVYMFISKKKLEDSVKKTIVPTPPVSTPVVELKIEKKNGPCEFKCPACYNTYSDREKYGVKIDDVWYCNSTCRTIHKTRIYAQKHVMPNTWSSNMITVFPLRVVPLPLGGVKMIF